MTASWKTPRVLLKYLTIWSARDDTRPDPAARAAVDEAVAAIGDMIGELAALRARLTGEMAEAEGARAADLADAGPRMGSTLTTLICCTTRMPRPAPGRDSTCPDCGVVWEYADEPADPFGPGSRVKGPYEVPEVAHLIEESRAGVATKPYDVTSPHKCASAMPELAHEDPPDDSWSRMVATATGDHPAAPPLYIVPDTYVVPGPAFNAVAPAVCAHRNGMPDTVAGTWHCHDCGSDVYDDEQLAAIQGAPVPAEIVRAVPAAGAGGQ